jgi:hypothetical protein
LPFSLAKEKSLLVLLIVKVLLRDTATEVLGLGTTDVDILEQNLRGGVGSGHGLGLLDFGVDALACLLVDGLELGFGGDFPVENLLLEAGDGVLGAAHALDFLASLREKLVRATEGGGERGKTNAVGGAGVGHGVASVSVGDEFVDEGTLAVGGPLLAECDGLLAGKDVHAVDLETGDVLATLVVLGDGRRAVGSGTHTVLVV